jgi:hypothetical protein
MEDMLDRVLPRIGGTETLDRLAALSGSDFTSVMLEVARRRAARETPASVQRRYERDRFVRPGQVPARPVRRVEDALLGCLPEDVEVVQLAPLVPLGTHSALGPVSQDKVVSTIRASEVAAAVSAGRADVVTDRERQAGRGYYRDLCFKVNVPADGGFGEVGDGGFTDWTARLTANAKERLLILGLATDRLAAIAPPGRGR